MGNRFNFLFSFCRLYEKYLKNKDMITFLKGMKRLKTEKLRYLRGIIL